MIDDDDLIDGHRSAPLWDVGLPDYLAAVTVTADGSTRLVLASLNRLNDDPAEYDAACADIHHEQTGALPIEYVRRITVSQRTRRHDSGTA